MIKKPHLDTPAGRDVFKRLNEVAHRTGLTIHGVALRYALERFLYRLFLDRDSADRGLMFNPGSVLVVDPESIILKGGLTLTFAEGVPPHQGRATGDADLHLTAFRGGMEDYANLVRRVLAADYPDDGVCFDIDAISVSRDREERTGGSLVVPLQLGAMWLQIKTDVTLDARPMHQRAPSVRYPSILEGDTVPPAIVRRVPWEFMLADKIGAAFENGALNKRLRDYGDMRLILERQIVDDEYLAENMAGTMRFKGRHLPESMDMAPGFSDAFAAKAEARWSHEKVKKRFQIQDPLSDIMPWLRVRLQPVLEKALEIDPLPDWSSGPR